MQRFINGVCVPGRLFGDEPDADVRDSGLPGARTLTSRIYMTKQPDFMDLGHKCIRESGLCLS